MSNIHLKHSVLWTSLSETQKQHGVNPATLGAMEYDINESALSSSTLDQLRSFFMGSKAAMSDVDFRSESAKLLEATDPSLKPIQEIAQKAIGIQLSENACGSYSLDFEGEGFGRPYREYKAKFGNVYNKLIDENNAFLMHPARHSELIDYLKREFPNTKQSIAIKRLAERLITFRCFGEHGLKVSEQKRTVKETEIALQKAKNQSSALAKLRPRSIKKAHMLKKTDLDCIKDDYCKKHVLLAYQRLASRNQLHILNLPEHELYQYHCGSNECTHPELETLAKNYYERSMLGYNYSMVVKHLISLKTSDLKQLKQDCLAKEIENQTWRLDHKKRSLKDAQKKLQNQLMQLKTKQNHFCEGDFSFLSDPFTIRMLSNAYKAITELDTWSFFDTEPPEDSGYMFWSHPTLLKIGNELSVDDHSRATMAFTMRWMQMIHNKGWAVIVREMLLNNDENAGMLNKVYEVSYG